MTGEFLLCVDDVLTISDFTKTVIRSACSIVNVRPVCWKLVKKWTEQNFSRITRRWWLIRKYYVRARRAQNRLFDIVTWLFCWRGRIIVFSKTNVFCTFRRGFFSRPPEFTYWVCIYNRSPTLEIIAPVSIYFFRHSATKPQRRVTRPVQSRNKNELISRWRFRRIDRGGLVDPTKYKKRVFRKRRLPVGRPWWITLCRTTTVETSKRYRVYHGRSPRVCAIGNNFNPEYVTAEWWWSSAINTRDTFT